MSRSGKTQEIESAPTVWRVRMKSGKLGVNHAAAKMFAFSYGWVGAGWGLDGSAEQATIPDGSPDFRAYLSAARRVFPGDLSLEAAANRIGTEMSIGDHCWTYDPETGEYWCGKVTGPFIYRQTGDFDRHDLHMLRPCDWKRVGGADAVPEVINRAFVGPFGTITRIRQNAGDALKTAEAAFSR